MKTIFCVEICDKEASKNAIVYADPQQVNGNGTQTSQLNLQSNVPAVIPFLVAVFASFPC